MQYVSKKYFTFDQYFSGSFSFSSNSWESFEEISIMSRFISTSLIRESSGRSRSSECFPACSSSKYPFRTAQQTSALASSRIVYGRSIFSILPEIIGADKSWRRQWSRYCAAVSLFLPAPSRVTYSVVLPRLAPETIEAFILAQLDRAGLGHNTFTPEALALIVRSGEGFLRRTRNLCLGSLIEAVRDQTRTADLKQVNRVLIQPHWRKDCDQPIP